MLPSEVFFNNFLDSMDNDKKMQCDIYEKDNNINIEMDIPGFNKEDINIEINKGNLVVTAEKNEEENEDKKYLRRERKFYGKYQRSFYLGEIDEENIEASFENGILKISIPKKTEEETKKLIEIK
jgi:HSP20 family protein